MYPRTSFHNSHQACGFPHAHVTRGPVGVPDPNRDASPRSVYLEPTLFRDTVLAIIVYTLFEFLGRVVERVIRRHDLQDTVK